MLTVGKFKQNTVYLVDVHSCINKISWTFCKDYYRIKRIFFGGYWCI